MKHILKFIIGFSVVMVILLSLVVVVKYGWYVLYAVASVYSVCMCYYLGDVVWKVIESNFGDQRSYIDRYFDEYCTEPKEDDNDK